jgi:hypothetical protein
MGAATRRAALACACLAAIAPAGCAAGFAVGLGPRVDTDGVVGIEAGVRGDFGMGVESLAIVAEAGPVGAVSFAPATPAVGFDAGLAYQEELVAAPLALRGGIRGRFLWADAGGWHDAMGVGGAFAVLPTLRETDTWTEHLGVEAVGAWISAEHGSGRSDRRNAGLFSLAVVYSRLHAVAGPQLAFLPDR